MKRNGKKALRLLIALMLIISLTTPDLVFAESAAVSAATAYEEGRYAVGSGVPVEASDNIRTSIPIAVTGWQKAELRIASPYTVTIHQYRDNTLSSFIESIPRIEGYALLDLNPEAQYIHLSIRRKDNTSISPEEGSEVQINEGIDQEDERLALSFWMQGRYAVFTGEPLESSTNIRLADFVSVKGRREFYLKVPSQYTVTIHEYTAKAYSGFSRSTTNLSGDCSIELGEDTEYILASVRRIDNAEITVNDGKEVWLSFYLITAPESGPAMLTIIDNDANEQYYTQLFPLAKEKGISISSSVPAAFPGSTGYMTWDMIKDCQNTGMEILCHTYSHPLSTTISSMTQQDFQNDYQTAKDVFALHGINSDLLVFSGSTGQYSQAQNAVRNLFEGALLAGDNATNTFGGDPYNIEQYRVGTDYPFEINTLKGLIDSLNQSQGWMVWMLHTSNSASWNSSVTKTLGQAIDYAKELNIPIVSAKQGFEYFYENSEADSE